MEKYSQFRDKGTGIAPFLPVPSTPLGIYMPLRVLLFAIRLPILLFVTLAYFFVFCWLPIGSLGKKAALWLILGVPGIWWVDLQVDGVRRGSLGSKSSLSRLPQPSSVIVSSTTSPIDALYLAAIFDPVFTISYPNSRLLQRTTLFHSMLRALLPPQLYPPPSVKSGGKSASGDAQPNLVTLAELTRAHPKRIICVLPECTTTNGRGVLPLSPCLLTASSHCKIFPTSVRYTPPDVTTPVPGWSEAGRFLWNLCSRTTHTIRVRVAEAVYNTSVAEDGAVVSGAEDSDDLIITTGNGTKLTDGLTAEERRVLDKVGEALARLGRVKRVGLGMREKIDFIKIWSRRRR